MKILYIVKVIIFFKLIFFFNLINNYIFANQENFLLSKETLKDIKKITNFKIYKNFKLLVYDKKFAKILGLDDALAIVMPKDLYAVGITIDKISKAKIKNKFYEYNLKIHIFIKHSDNYALPDSEWGDWFSLIKMHKDINFLTNNSLVYPNQKIFKNYTMTSYIGNDNLKDNMLTLDNYIIKAGSANIDYYQKNIYPGIDYIGYVFFPSNIPYSNENISIWIRKKDTLLNKNHNFGIKKAKDFYQFSLPEVFRNKICIYLQKIYLEFNWRQYLINYKGQYYGSKFVKDTNDYKCS